MQIDCMAAVNAIVAQSQHSKCPLELVVLDDCWCLRSAKDKSWTLTAGSKGQSKEDAFKHIWEKLTKTRNQRIVMLLGGEPGKKINPSKIILPLAVKGLY